MEFACAIILYNISKLYKSKFIEKKELSICDNQQALQPQHVSYPAQLTH